MSKGSRYTDEFKKEATNQVVMHGYCRIERGRAAKRANRGFGPPLVRGGANFSQAPRGANFRPTFRGGQDLRPPRGPAAKRARYSRGAATTSRLPTNTQAASTAKATAGLENLNLLQTRGKATFRGGRAGGRGRGRRGGQYRA